MALGCHFRMITSTRVLTFGAVAVCGVRRGVPTAAAVRRQVRLVSRYRRIGANEQWRR